MFLPRPPVALWVQEAGGRDTLGAVLLLPPTCAQPQEHSPHNSRRPPQATAQATCGPVTPYQHVMGERRPQLRPGSPRRAGPGAARTRRYFGADFVPARMLAIFHEEQVELLGAGGVT